MTALPRIYLPWTKTSALSANARTHWATKARLVKAQRRIADALARKAGWHKIDVPAGASLHMRLTYCPPSVGGLPDDDNVLTAHKGARDAFADVLGINDRSIRGTAVLGNRCKDGAVIVDMTIEESGWQSIGDLAAGVVSRTISDKGAAE